MDDWYSKPNEKDVVDDRGRLVLSASSVTTFLRCGLQWKFAYVNKIRRPPTIKQSLGIAAHTAYETNMLAKLETEADLPEEAVIDVFSGEYDRLIVETEDPDEDPGAAKDQQIKVVRKQHNEIAPLIVPVMVEEPFIYEIDGKAYSGTIDLVDGVNKVRDWKNTARKPDLKGSNYTLGMVGYALGYRHLTGQKEAEIQIDFLVRHKKKAPDYYPMPSGGPVSDAAIGRFADIVEQVYSAIMSGTFVPNGLTSGSCSWCGFRDICPAYKNQR